MRKLWAAWAMMIGFVVAAPTAGADTVTSEQLAARIDQATPLLLLDVRSAEEFATGHIRGARLIPHDQLAARLAELGAPREVVVYCRSGRRVGLIRPLLEEAGFSVRELEGSFLAWQAAGLPIETGETP